jgi:tetratricopeptide (TPR) repeat protein
MRLLDKAVEIDPDEPILQARRSDVLLVVGRMSDAVAAARRATELNPLWSYVRSQYILTLTYAGQFSRAKAEIADAHRKWPNNIDIDWADFGFQYRYGDPRLAEQLMPRAMDNPDADMAPNLKVMAARLDPTPAKIEAAIEAVRARSQPGSVSENKVLLALGTFGKFDEAWQLLNDPKFQPFLETSILFRPEFAALRADPRFMGVAARAGLVRYWRDSGNWPDFCSSEKLKYDCKTEMAKYR